MFKKFISFIFILFALQIFLVLSKDVSAEEAKETKTAVTIVNPIRGNDFWNYSYGKLEAPQNQYEIISKNSLPATWLIRYDALKDPEVIQFLRSFNSQQEIGLFLEVTPTSAIDAGVNYNQSPNWHYARSVLLTGYSTSDREKLIDKAVEKYKELFGKNPKSVGAWWIDAYSLNYLKEKYDIEANLDVADQYSTDQYQVWGQYFSTPFYPSKVNALMPASSADKKIGVVTIQWATRDPYNAYGNGVNDSTYSVQVNDYMIHNLGINYFEKLLDIYPQVTVGLENDFDWRTFGSEYQRQVETLVKKRNQGKIAIQSMADFALSYRKLYPDVSPSVLIVAGDPLGSSGKVVWYQTPKYRVGWFANPSGSVIRDLRLFNDGVKEKCFDVVCKELNLADWGTNNLDDVTLSTKWVIDEGKISNIQVNKIGNGVEINYLNQSGTNRLIKFLPNDIEANGKIQPISFAIMNASEQSVSDKADKLSASGSLDLQMAQLFPKLILGLGKFILLIVLFFLIPGYVISRKWIVAIPLGVVIFTLASFTIGRLGNNLFLWLIPLSSTVLLFKTGLPRFYVPKISVRTLIAGATIIIGSASWLLTTVKSGLLYQYGYGYWGPNGHDGIWHLALISELQRNIIPSNPIFAGEKLSNYHYFFDLLVAKSGSIFLIDNQDLLFRFFPLLLAPLAGLLIFKVVETLSKDYKAGIWSIFFLYFGGSFGWIVSLFKDQSLGGESMFWAQQAISTMLNPPFAISIVLLLSGFYLFTEYLNQKKVLVFNLFLPIVFIWGSVIEFKAYAGVLVLGSLGLLTLERFIIRREKQLIPLFIACLVLSLVVFLPNNIGSSSLFVFSPLWFVYTMILFPDRLGWTRVAFTLESGNIIKVVGAYGLGTLIFLIGNLGTRVLALGSVNKLSHNRFLLYFIALGTIIPLLAIQEGTNWNTIQFFYYSIVVLNIFTALTLSRIQQLGGRKVGIIAIAIVILLTVPTSYNTINQYLPSRPPARLSKAEVDALEFLRQQPQGIVLTLNFDQKLKERYLEPVPLLAYTSTGYVSAFSNHPTFLEDTVNLDILGIDYKGRLNEQRNFLKVRDEAGSILKRNNISYVYTVKLQGFEEDEGKMGIKKIFENNEVKIFKVM